MSTKLKISGTHIAKIIEQEPDVGLDLGRAIAVEVVKHIFHNDIGKVVALIDRGTIDAAVSGIASNPQLMGIFQDTVTQSIERVVTGSKFKASIAAMVEREAKAVATEMVKQMVSASMGKVSK